MHLAQLADERGEAMDTSAASPAPCMQAPTALHQQSTEAALARYYLLSEQARDIILFIRQDGRIVEANHAAIAAYGYDRETLLTMSIYDLRDPATVPQVVPQMAQADDSGILFETLHRRQDGSVFPVEVSSTGTTIGGERLLLSIIRDITKRKKAEAALQQAHAALEQRVQERTTALQHAMAERQRLERDSQRAEHFALLGRLAAGVSHEIRNPLGAVFLHVDLLEEELHDPSTDSRQLVAESLSEIRTHLARIEDLVQDYLSLVRVAHIERTPQNLGAAVQAWAAEMQGLAVACGVTMHLEGLETLGQVTFHAGTLRRAVGNLMRNALEAMQQGGILMLVGLGTMRQAQLQVRDTGSGIPAERLGQIFEPLYTTKPGGTGLGLYIAQEIVTAHEGQLTVQSAEGQGTTFTITLPRATAGTYNAVQA
jgi:PAS domain S-box-containing protein